jgi:hypothetical protein
MSKQKYVKCCECFPTGVVWKDKIEVWLIFIQCGDVTVDTTNRRGKIMKNSRNREVCLVLTRAHLYCHMKRIAA